MQAVRLPADRRQRLGESCAAASIRESGEVLMLDPAKPSEFAFVDAVPLRVQGDPGTHRGFERAPLLELFRVHALLPRSAGGMRFQKFNVISNRALDPLGFQVGMLVL